MLIPRRLVPRLLLMVACWLPLPGCAPALQRGEAGKPAAQQPWSAPLKGPAEVKTPAGATLKVPAGMVARQRNNVILLQDPEASASVQLVELDAGDCATAVKQAWAAVDPAFKGEVKRTDQPPASRGYDEIYVVTYVRGEDDRVAQVVARRKGQRVWVAVIRGTPPSLDKRGAQLRTFLASIKAPGVKEDDLSGKSPRPMAQKRAELLEFISRAMAAENTPGLQIAVVEGGKVTLAEGFGVRKLGQPGKVTPDTLMMIGSVTKSLSTLMMATLVDAGKLDWKRPVTAVYPAFKLGDPALTKAITVEQLVCACAGLPRKDVPLILDFSDKSAADVFKELSTMRPSTGLKETFQYQNHMVAAVGLRGGPRL